MMDRDVFFNNISQLGTNRNLSPPAANAVPLVPPGLGNTPPQNTTSSNPYKTRNINNNPSWISPYNPPYSEQVDMDSRSGSFREMEAKKKIRMYVYTAHLLSTPLNLPVGHML